MLNKRNVIIIGGGPAGMAAAIKLKKIGLEDVIILEKEETTGGVLRQCIHPGFGLEMFGKNYTGPEYKCIYEDKLKELNVEVNTETTVVSVEAWETWCNRKKSDARAGIKAPDGMIYSDEMLNTYNLLKMGRIVVTAYTSYGFIEYAAEAVLMATGCRERGRGFLKIPGSRPAGIYTAGTVQGLMNLKNIKVGERAVIIGSGDIGLIMARRMTLEGSQVVCVVEKESVCGGLERNRRDCLVDFGIPLFTNSTVCNIKGKKRVEAVTVRDEKRNETDYECDTVVLSAGLVPEDEMAEKGIEGLFYCGNALYVHDLVDYVSDSGECAALEIFKYLMCKTLGRKVEYKYSAGNLDKERLIRKQYLEMRRKLKAEKNDVSEEFIICTQCPNGCKIDKNTFAGGKCDKGAEFVKNEIENPKRILTSTVAVKESCKLVSVRTEEAIPKYLIKSGMKEINSIEITAPVKVGDIIIEDFMKTGINLIATCNLSC